MTEESYQQCRKVMQQINHLRGLISKQKGEVAKWSNIEDSFRKQLKESNADGAKKMLEKALKKLDELRTKFDLMIFPDSNIVVAKKKRVQCEGCGSLIAEGNIYCGECLCEDDRF